MFLFIIMLLKPFVVGNCSAKGLFPIFLQSVYKATLIVWKKKTTLFCKIIAYKNTDEPFGPPIIGKIKKKYSYAIT